MPMKLAVKLDHGRPKIVSTEVPDPEEVKRLWRQGKSIGWIVEELLNKGKRKPK